MLVLLVTPRLNIMNENLSKLLAAAKKPNFT